MLHYRCLLSMSAHQTKSSQIWKSKVKPKIVTHHHRLMNTWLQQWQFGCLYMIKLIWTWWIMKGCKYIQLRIIFLPVDRPQNVHVSRIYDKFYTSNFNSCHSEHKKVCRNSLAWDLQDLKQYDEGLPVFSGSSMIRFIITWHRWYS